MFWVGFFQKINKRVGTFIPDSSIDVIAAKRLGTLAINVAICSTD